MTDRPETRPSQPAQRGAAANPYQSRPQPTDLADLLERVLDKGVVLAGDIRVNLLDIELLTIKIRLLLVSVDKAQEMGIDWWRTDPMLSSAAHREAEQRETDALREENRRLRAALEDGGTAAGPAAETETELQSSDDG